MTDERSRKMLMTIRAALIMAAKAIEEYCREEPEVLKSVNPVVESWTMKGV